jgi:TonB family protein
MRGIERIALLLFFLACSGLLCFAQDARTKYQGKVVSVADGNTLTLLVDEQKLSVRLLGIDAPSQALRDASRENLSRLVSGKSVAFLSVPLELVAGKQKIRVGKVLLNDADVALSQLDSGFAWQSNEFEKYQNPEEQQLYVAAEQRAKESKLGIWSDSFKACKDAAIKTSVETSANPGSKNTKRPKVSGTVIVEVTVDESGNVIAARALCGHPILQTVAVKAASQAKFSRQPDRITGNIVYNFVPE